MIQSRDSMPIQGALQFSILAILAILANDFSNEANGPLGCRRDVPTFCSFTCTRISVVFQVITFSFTLQAK
jgi:hypothetical protein